VHQIAQICTCILKNVQGVMPLDPHDWGWGKRLPQALPHRRASIVPLFQMYCGRWVVLVVVVAVVAGECY